MTPLENLADSSDIIRVSRSCRRSRKALSMAAALTSLLVRYAACFVTVISPMIRRTWRPEPGAGTQMAVFWSKIRGRYAPLFWGMVACNFVIPFPILAIRQLRTITGTLVASLFVIVGMWLERFLIVVPSLSFKQLPYAWGDYRPSWVEITILAGTFAAMILLYLLFSKLVPIISIWELKGSPKAQGRPAPAENFQEEPVRQS